eukprot:CAMPEP_0196792786 /NCGR_PEP_ID=MMETSP1104-20130614/31975_1 /TAXON_ID=33652 /ORGANISM="Cafeteria sp., Strain Caron Lab Isolate" /LENGTH=54 /DNA_ID=CAMNT_0042163151 /DNA_START=1 /DNA_END=162 /DNA_ORIENTATION=-
MTRLSAKATHSLPRSLELNLSRRQRVTTNVTTIAVFPAGINLAPGQARRAWGAG